MHYKELEVWKEAINLVTYIYKKTEIYPKNEVFGIVSQIRRCVVSIPSNIAEGVVKHSDKESLRFSDIALGSLAELETQIIISKNLGYIENLQDFDIQISKVNALLNGLINYYNKQIKENNVLVP